jgi:L-histidine N-alpha-methyltransferase
MDIKFTDLCLKTPENSTLTQFAEEIDKGLSLENKRLPSWLIYDNEGSVLFQEINGLEGYHPTYCETEIFNEHKVDITKSISSQSFNLIELGAGDGRKTTILLDYFIQKKLDIKYIPIDVSQGAIKNLSNALKDRYENDALSFHGLTADYFQGINWLNENSSQRNLVFFLGSSIGNFDIFSAQRFLKHLRDSLSENDLTLIGFDLMKNPKLLHSAYNDPKGVFQKFNLHLLDRINEELGGNFDTNKFVQCGTYNVKSRAVESFIYSTEEQNVRLNALDKEFHFDLWEGMQTEHSYKYTIPIIEKLAESSGFEIVNHFFDQNHYFVDSLWKLK